MHFSRREFLTVSSSLGLTFRLSSEEQLFALERGGKRGTSLIVVWLQGGPSQLETWDPHEGTKIGGPTKAINTVIPGTKIASGYPLLAERLNRLNVIRSLVSKEGDHERASYYVKTGYRPDPTVVHPSLAAIHAAKSLSTDRHDLPASMTLGDSQFPSRGAYLGAQYDAFRIVEPGNAIGNLTPMAGAQRQKRRLADLDFLSRSFRYNRPQSESMTSYQVVTEDALSMMSSPELSAFQIDQESEGTRQRYGKSRFGSGCLVARRLVEAGVRSVEVVLGGFDSHAKNFEIHDARAIELDRGLSALMDDLIERDLWSSTMVLCLGEFGRSPQINALDGRDHWPTGFSCLVGGAGLREGIVIGQTDPTGEKKDPVDPVAVHDLYATVLRQLRINPEEELMTPIGRPLALCAGKPIERLLQV